MVKGGGGLVLDMSRKWTPETVRRKESKVQVRSGDENSRREECDQKGFGRDVRMTKRESSEVLENLYFM
jgi:hypothetical protein